jgi:hypothetical protein
MIQRTRLQALVESRLKHFPVVAILGPQADLKLDRIDLVHAGSETFSLSPKVRALSAARLLDDLAPLRAG